jgi:hypothetical protein
LLKTIFFDIKKKTVMFVIHFRDGSILQNVRLNRLLPLIQAKLVSEGYDEGRLPTISDLYQITSHKAYRGERLRSLMDYMSVTKEEHVTKKVQFIRCENHNPTSQTV